MTLPPWFWTWDAIGPVGHHLWQSTLFAAIAGLLALTLKNNRAEARYWLWLTASVKFLIPFALLVSVGSQLAWQSSKTIVQPDVIFVVDAVSQPFSAADVRAAAAPSPAAASASVAASLTLPLTIFAIWLCGGSVVLMTWWMRWLRVAVAVRDATPVLHGRELDALRRLERTGRIRKSIDLVSSNAALAPGVFGIVRPVLVWPREVAERLGDEQLDAILAHELCHVRRRDNLAAAVHTFVEAVRLLVSSSRVVAGCAIGRRARAGLRRRRHSIRQRSAGVRREHSRDLPRLRRIAACLCRWCLGSRSQETNRADHEERVRRKIEFVEKAPPGGSHSRGDRRSGRRWCAEGAAGFGPPNHRQSTPASLNQAK